MELQEVLRYPLMGEKATFLREGNKLTFIVDKKASKSDIKEAIEKLYNVKVSKVKTMSTMEGLKKAYVTLDKAYSAEEIASQFGVI
ncbi:MAG: 50S ribosomal protein L23 [Candidatus Altiarchaeales archaeon]|nr:50S ribosomal protein L23 [Candidatus Altiarchaeales archaeon]